jgi:hypothetical protein
MIKVGAPVTGVVIQAGQHLFCKHKALSSNPNPTKKKKKKKTNYLALCRAKANSF